MKLHLMLEIVYELGSVQRIKLVFAMLCFTMADNGMTPKMSAPSAIAIRCIVITFMFIEDVLNNGNKNGLSIIANDTRLCLCVASDARDAFSSSEEAPIDHICKRRMYQCLLDLIPTLEILLDNDPNNVTKVDQILQFQRRFLYMRN